MIEKEFIKATKKWYKYIVKDHHKDHDCHWYLNQVNRFSYGEEETQEYWEMVHNGYIADDLYFDGETREDVLEKATKWIKDYLKDNKIKK